MFSHAHELARPNILYNGLVSRRAKKATSLQEKHQGQPEILQEVQGLGTGLVLAKLLP